MTRDIDGVIAWAEAHPRTPATSSAPNRDWDGYCEMLVADAGGYTNSFGTATLDLAAASKVYTAAQLPIADVPEGWLLHWAYVSARGTNYGHVAFATRHGALMASSYCTTEIHSNLGFIRAGDYTHVSGHAYLGASPDHGGQYLKGIPHAHEPSPVARYVVRPGDTLTAIGARLHVKWPAIYAANRALIGADPNKLRIGAKLVIPR